MIAYNFMSLYRQEALQKQPTPTFDTSRFICFAV